MTEPHTIAALSKYLHHLNDCACGVGVVGWRESDRGLCNCGLESVLAGITVPPSQEPPYCCCHIHGTSCAIHGLPPMPRPACPVPQKEQA
jgi:hypothetical protein